MNEDLMLMNEYEAVRKLVEKTRAEFVFRGTRVCPVVELIPILTKEHDREKHYLLDNGPTDDKPGVYILDRNGDIQPERCYAPVDPGSYTQSGLGVTGANYHALSPMKTHVDFDE